jgi:hypothetical protein
MTKNILIAGILVVTASCGRYSKVLDLPKKEEYKENTRVYGEHGAPAHQSKNTYTAAPDAAEKSVKIKEILFGTAVANSQETAQNQAPAAVSTDSASVDSIKK